MSEMPSVYNETFPRARLSHKCCECGRAIAPGQTYCLAKGCWDGEWETFKTCAPCNNLRTTLNKSVGRDTPLDFGELLEAAYWAGVEFPPKAKEAINAES
jgi:hypothetical protein